MDFHLERGLRLQTEPEHENLYTWAINEIDAQSRPIGRDQIPWEWTLYFTATSCVLGDSIDVESKFRIQQTASAPPEIAQRQVIRVQLSPGDPRDEGPVSRPTRCSAPTEPSKASNWTSIQSARRRRYD